MRFWEKTIYAFSTGNEHSTCLTKHLQTILKSWCSAVVGWTQNAWFPTRKQAIYHEQSYSSEAKF